MEQRSRLMKSIPYQLSRLGSLALLALFCGSATFAFAGSATWQQDPATGNWNTPTNWNPATIPNGPSDVATFSVSNQTNVTVTSSIILDSIVFQPDASAFTITTSSAFASVLINGAGVIDNSALTQNFFVNAAGRDQGALNFAGSASAGDAIYSQGGAAVRNSFGGTTSFFNTSTAATATFFLDGGAANGAAGGGVIFFDSSTAGSANFTLNPGMVPGATGGHLEFANSSTAGSSTIIVNGAQNATGGTVFFLDDSTGGTANVVLLGNGTLDLTLQNAPGVTLASVQGDGLVSLGSSRLTINTTLVVSFAGVISGAGSLAKMGRGTYDLTNGSTYTGGTMVREGTLLVDNTNGSATGMGPVRVASGALGGTGTIAGPVIVGSDTPGNGSFLTPGQSFNHPGTLTLLDRLNFKSDGFFNVGLGANATVGQVVANGVKINNGATFAFFNNRGVTVPVGMVLILIDNTSATPIAGQFDNLPDGLVFTDHGNTFEVSYTGGDGNDLTITSLP
jgi:autotransporter-associated beta strand protein